MTRKMIAFALLASTTTALEMIGSHRVAFQRGCGTAAAPSASDGGTLVVVGGDYDDDCADRIYLKEGWIDVLTAEGDLFHETIYEGAAPAFTATNAKTGASAALAETSDGYTLFLFKYRAGDTRVLEYAYDGPEPLGLAVLNPEGLVAIFSSDAVTVYEAVGGALEARSSVEREHVAGWGGSFKQFVFDPFPDDCIYVGGTLDDGDRAVVKIQVEDTDLDVVWTASAGTDNGTPRLHLRRTDPGAAAAEVLLLSKQFYVRLDAADGSRIFLRETRNLWLPEDDGAKATYDATRDALYSTGDGTKVRKHRVSTGALLWERDIYDDALDALNPEHGDETFRGSQTRTSGVHATSDGTLHVVVVFQGDDDVDGYFSTHVVRYADHSDENGDEDVETTPKSTPWPTPTTPKSTPWPTPTTPKSTPWPTPTAPKSTPLPTPWPTPTAPKSTAPTVVEEASSKKGTNKGGGGIIYGVAVGCLLVGMLAACYCRGCEHKNNVGTPPAVDHDQAC